MYLSMPSDAFKSFCTHKRSEEERLTAGNRGLHQAAEQQPVHPKWVRGATTVKHYVFEVILWSFCALFKTLTTSYQSRRLLELHRNTNGAECVMFTPDIWGYSLVQGALPWQTEYPALQVN